MQQMHSPLGLSLSISDPYVLYVLILSSISNGADFLSIPLTCSRFISSKALFPRSSRTFATRYFQTSKSSKIHFGNFAKNLTKALTPLTWITQKISTTLFNIN
jgi:hypothetical protein